jgi:DNA-binding MarR family transcriptional regulator
MTDHPLSDADYAKLLDLRTGLRVFLRWSEEQAERAGLSPAQHQLLLAVRGNGGGTQAPSVGDLAHHLLLRQHSVSELLDRCTQLGLVSRGADPQDGRVVRIHLTAEGRDRLEQLSVRHLEEIDRLARRIGPLIRGLVQTPST